jgi:hypothetical protein
LPKQSPKYYFLLLVYYTNPRSALLLEHTSKGAATTASKFKSLKGRWFSQKGVHEFIDGDKDGERYIQRDSPIKVHCKRGEIISVENYMVLAFFTKY